MKVQIHIGKTIQEFQYEPFNLSLSVEKEIPDTSNLREETEALYSECESILEFLLDCRKDKIKLKRRRS